jgi:hypothetical protein
MRMLSSLLPASLLTLALAAPASAEMLTLGSDLSQPASSIESQGADTAFWPVNVNGAAVSVPEDGQVVAIKVKGSALSERGAPNGPATMIHFQSLDPAGANGARTVYLTSGDFSMPVDNPSAVSEFKPENLCVRKGGSVAFNTIGGFRWGGSFGAPLTDFYTNGTPWQIFAPVSTSSVAWYSRDNGTNNGATLTPAGGTTAHDGFGSVIQGKEILMQLIVATGDDRSQSCGGPRRHPDGTLVDVTPDPNYVKVATSGGKPQQPYVTKDRRFTVGVYCGGQTSNSCAGTATMLVGKRVLVSVPFSMPVMKTGKIAMRLKTKDFKKLDKSKSRTLKTTFVLVSNGQTFSFPLTLKR